jgi:hypothetical protein
MINPLMLDHTRSAFLSNVDGFISGKAICDQNLIHYAFEVCQATWQMLRLIQRQDDGNEFHGLRAIAIIDLANGSIRPTRSKCTSTKPASRSNSPRVSMDQNLM